MAAKMDKSLEDIIAEERSKSKPRAASSAKPRGKSEQDHRRPAAAKNPRPDSRRDTRRSGPKPDVDGPPPRDPAYYLHDDRDGGFGGREQQGGVPRGSWKQQQRQQWDRQQQWEQPRPRGRGSAAAITDPIITTADGWEEVAQEEPHNDRRGYGAQRRGGVFERLSRDSGRYDSRDRCGGQQQFGGGRMGRGRGGGGRGGRGDFEGEPRRRYIDEHDHREDQEPAGRPGRFQPYRVAGGVSKRTSRPGPVRGKWGHDLFNSEQPEGPVGGGDEYGGEGMME